MALRKVWPSHCSAIALALAHGECARVWLLEFMEFCHAPDTANGQYIALSHTKFRGSLISSLCFHTYAHTHTQLCSCSHQIKIFFSLLRLASLPECFNARRCHSYTLSYSSNELVQEIIPQVNFFSYFRCFLCRASSPPPPTPYPIACLTFSLCSIFVYWRSCFTLCSLPASAEHLKSHWREKSGDGSNGIDGAPPSEILSLSRICAWRRTFSLAHSRICMVIIFVHGKKLSFRSLGARRFPSHDGLPSTHNCSRPAI